MFACDKCDNVFNALYYLKEHIEVKHEGAVNRCPLCDATFTFKSNIGHHIKAMHGSQMFNCKECDYQGKTKRHLTVHIGLWHKEKNFKCKYCEFKAGYQHHINRHMKKRHRNVLNVDERKKFDIQKCPYCEYQNMFSVMKIHIKAHEKKRYICQYCEFSTGITSSLYDHARSLHPNDAFICNECPFTTNSEAKMKLQNCLQNRFSYM